MQYTERKRWLLFALPWTFTVYTIDDDMINIKSGLLRVVENDCYMYKVQDVALKSTLMQRMVGIGDIEMHTGDTTDPIIVLKNIKHSKEIKNYILEASEVARMRRRTMYTSNIGAGGMNDMDGDGMSDF